MAITKKEPPTKPKAGTKAAREADQVEKGKRVATAPKAGALAMVDEDMLAQDAQRDKQVFSSDELAIPFLRVLQALSPQCVKGSPQYNEDAEPGMFINSATGELWDGDEGIVLIPVAFTTSYTEFRIREKGGGFIQDHGPVRPNIAVTRDDKNRDIRNDNKDHQIVRAGLYYVFLVNEEDGSYQQMAYPLSGTQLKKSRQWNEAIRALRVPIKGVEQNPAPYYMSYKLTTVPESNEKGNWMGVVIEPYRAVVQELENGAQLYLAARAARQSIDAGRTKVKMDEIVDAKVEEPTSEEASAQTAARDRAF